MLTWRKQDTGNLSQVRLLPTFSVSAGVPYYSGLSVLTSSVAKAADITGTVLAVSPLIRWVFLVSLEFIGRYSLHIYLMHLLITPVTRILLVRSGIDSPGILITVSMIAGVGLPLVAAILLENRVPWLFNIPPALQLAEKVKK